MAKYNTTTKESMISQYTYSACHIMSFTKFYASKQIFCKILSFYQNIPSMDIFIDESLNSIVLSLNPLIKQICSGPYMHQKHTKYLHIGSNHFVFLPHF